jgi:hypothetical protein
MGRTTRANTYIPGGGPVVAGQRGRAKSARATGIAILADELEWRALAEDNPLFEFADYESYLLSVEKRMRAAARAGRQVMVGLLMPDQFETRADATGLPRDSPRALKEYERFVADLGPFTRPWRGEPIAQVLERLRAHVRAETLQSRAMPTLGAAAALHPHPDEATRRATAQASHVLMAVIEGCGDGQHEARIKVSHPEGELEYALPYTKSAEVIAFPDDGGEQIAIVLLAIASLAERPGSMVVRSRPQIDFFPSRRRPKDALDAYSAAAAAANASGSPAYRELVLRGWRLGNAVPQPMSEGQLFAFSCTGPSGEPVPPEPGTRFRSAFPLNPGSCECCT